MGWFGCRVWGSVSMTAAWGPLPSDMCLPQLPIPGLAQHWPAWHQESLAPSWPAAEGNQDECRALCQASCQLAIPDRAVSAHFWAGRCCSAVQRALVFNNPAQWCDQQLRLQVLCCGRGAPAAKFAPAQGHRNVHCGGFLHLEPRQSSPATADCDVLLDKARLSVPDLPYSQIAP